MWFRQFYLIASKEQLSVSDLQLLGSGLFSVQQGLIANREYWENPRQY
jgi:hypothetical protein